MDAPLTFSVASATLLCVCRQHHKLFLFYKDMFYSKIEAEISEISINPRLKFGKEQNFKC